MFLANQIKRFLNQVYLKKIMVNQLDFCGADTDYLLIRIEPMFHITCGLDFLPFLVPLSKLYGLR